MQGISVSDLMGQFGKIKMIEGDLLDKLSESSFVEETKKHNFCKDCNSPMQLDGIKYHCGMCGRMRKSIVHGNRDRDNIVSGSIRITTGANKGRFYNITGDYTKTQMKIIVDQLAQNQSSYEGMSFPSNILNAAATQYNRIQKFITEDSIDEDGNVCGQKKFVRRGNIKDEVLAGLIYFEGVREKLVRKKRDIAMFMKLSTYGFSRGEDILRNLQAEGKIDIPVDEEPIEGYVDRYMDGLKINNPNYSAFVIEIVNLSETYMIGMSSQLSSKIVGAISVLITKCNLNITSAELEKATDNTKRNTSNKFYTIVMSNVGYFIPVFKKYNIPYR